MTDQQKQSAAEQINSLNSELMQQRAQAYEARLAQDAAEERIKAIKNALQGAALGSQFQKDQDAEAPAPDEE